MKKLLVVLVLVAIVAYPAIVLAGKKAEEKQEKHMEDIITPTSSLVAEYYKVVAQIKQLEEQIEVLERQLDRLDAVIKYQRILEEGMKTEETDK
jgi:TolA-binding protein